ncbi:dynein heavy chain protein [Salix suchowensis]|nr:dynein heavy chain protein [Salix suchowensis]
MLNGTWTKAMSRKGRLLAKGEEPTSYVMQICHFCRRVANTPSHLLPDASACNKHGGERLVADFSVTDALMPCFIGLRLKQFVDGSRRDIHHICSRPQEENESMGPMIELCASGEKTLERFRYQFPDDWLYSDQLRGEWSAYNEILKRKNDSIQEQLDCCRRQDSREQDNDVIVEWEQSRPVQGSLRADTAMNTINVLEGKITRVAEEYDLVCRAKEALDLELTRHTRLEPVFEELRDLKAVWTALSGVWNQIGELRELAWATVQPRKLRQQIDGLLSSTKEMPTRMRQYAAFEYVQDVLRGLLKSNSLISELKSEALKDRHWKQLFKVLKLPAQISLTLCVILPDDFECY